MKRLSQRRKPTQVAVHGDRPGCRVIPIVAASGGVGASTLAALLAGAFAARESSGSRPVGVLDLAPGVLSPWSDWVSPGLDPQLGEEGRGYLAEAVEGYTPATIMRCAAAMRGLEGVAVITTLRPDAGDSPIDVQATTDVLSVTVLDLAAGPSPHGPWLRQHAGATLLAIGGSADGVSAGLRVVAAWGAAGLPAEKLRPVVIGTAAGQLPRRARARLALLEGRTLPVQHVPFDRVLRSLGLAEALAGSNLAKATHEAVDSIAASWSESRACVGEAASPPAAITLPSDLSDSAGITQPKLTAPAGALHESRNTE